MNKKRILLIGETCWDEYMEGTINRLSPEAPVPVLNFKKKYTRMGMGLNVLNNLTNLKDKETKIDLITFDTGVKKRFIDKESGYQLLRVDHTITGEDNYVIEKDLSQYNVIIVSDYNKGFIGDNLYKQLLEHPKVIVDTKKKSIPCSGSTIIKINKKEYEEYITKARGNFVITLGSEGCRYLDTIYPTNKVEVIDVTGAGDSFLAGLALEMLTKDVREAIPFANKVASVAVSKHGTYAVKREDL